VAEANGLTGLHHFGLTVTDLDRTVDFYTRIVGFEFRSADRYIFDESLSPALFGEEYAQRFQGRVESNIAVLELGGVRVEFIQFVNPQVRPYHGDFGTAGSPNLALQVSDLVSVRTRLEEAGVAFRWEGSIFTESGFRPWQWCFFRDPDGIVVELVEDIPVANQLEALAEKTRRIRLARGLTLKEVANISQMSAAHLSQVERGEAIPSIPALLKIASALSITPDYLLREETDGDDSPMRRPRVPEHESTLPVSEAGAPDSPIGEGEREADPRDQEIHMLKHKIGELILDIEVMKESMESRQRTKRGKTFQ